MSRTESLHHEVSHTEEVSLCSVRLGEELFAIETSEVLEVLDRPCLRAVPLAPASVAGILPYRGEVLTAFSFRALLGRAKAGERSLKTDPGPVDEDVAGCILVLEDSLTGQETGPASGQEVERQWGLMVDEACGVLCLPKDSLEPNPGTLDARSMDLFGGVYRTPTALIVRIDPRRLLQARDGNKAKTGDIHHARSDR